MRGINGAEELIECDSMMVMLPEEARPEVFRNGSTRSFPNIRNRIPWWQNAFFKHAFADGRRVGCLILGIIPRHVVSRKRFDGTRVHGETNCYRLRGRWGFAKDDGFSYIGRKIVNKEDGNVEKTQRRGVILIRAALCGALTASLNCWSVFQKPLYGSIRMVSARGFFRLHVGYLIVGVSGPIGGWLQRRFSASLIMTIAGAGFGLGWFLLTGFASSIPVLGM